MAAAGVSVVLGELRELAALYGPSGMEGAVREYLTERLHAVSKRIYTDRAGNLVVFRRGTHQGNTWMFTAPMDQIGLIVTAANKRLKFAPYGYAGIAPPVGTAVVFANGGIGIVGEHEGERYIDAGVGRAASIAQVGDVAVIRSAVMCRDGFIAGSGLNNRGGCAVLLSAIRSIAGMDVKFDTYFVFTAQHLNGMKGAAYAAYQLRPTMAVTVEAVQADAPGLERYSVELGKGPVVKLRDGLHIGHGQVKRLLIGAAQRAGLPYQLTADREGATDSAAVHVSRDGVLTGHIAIPVRYLHTPNEACRETDLTQAAKLVAELVAGD